MAARAAETIASRAPYESARQRVMPRLPADSATSASSGWRTMSGSRSIWARFGVPWQPAYVFERSDGTSTFVNVSTQVR